MALAGARPPEAWTGACPPEAWTGACPPEAWAGAPPVTVVAVQPDGGQPALLMRVLTVTGAEMVIGAGGR